MKLNENAEKANLTLYYEQKSNTHKKHNINLEHILFDTANVGAVCRSVTHLNRLLSPFLILFADQRRKEDFFQRNPTFVTGKMP